MQFQNKRCIFLFTLILVVSVGFTQAQNTKKTITVFIDPGHGGGDPGNEARQDGMKDEKHLNLEIATKLGNYISERITNTKIIYSRTTDSKISLDSRVERANKSGADYFISIHCNSNPNKAIFGTRTHIHSNKFASSKKLANIIEHEFSTRAGRKSRGVMDARDRGYNLQALQYTKMPGVLVECGFMTNPTEEKFLNSELGQDYIASAIFRGFRTFLDEENVKVEDRSTVYKVQIMASTTPVNLKESRFQKLDIRVEEYKFPGQTYQYRYMVGREYDLDIAKKLMAKLRKEGFKDAFVVSLKDGEYKTNRVSR
ncbi:N-acetylmuramoyl-L-alanine amidase [Chondrinema litorale]|uniref:N-acetylmuramoyl-L-alanine amidase n=1 Tax=Chondrinema litorale TaxID=2994555 RepID=UPI002543CE83|nr:N-acetylmuramoyl-L-alanine amidase [Chondrinema litorale]UZR92494.1 N-acetylmuramoyl-L-alanine amidase [Chondrinema litorale]